MFRTFAILFAFFSLSGCWDDFDDEASTPLFNFSKITIERNLSSANCGCGANSGFYLRNTSNQAATARVQITSDRGGAPRKVRTQEFDVGAAGTRFIGCARTKGPNDMTGSSLCSRHHSYALESYQHAWVMPQFRFAIMTDLAPTATLTNTGPLQELPNCRFECRDPLGGNGLCTVLPSIQTDFAGDIAWLGRALVRALESGQSIPKAEIMEKFDVLDDPCERSDTGISGGKLTNTGLGCKLQAEVDTPRGRSAVDVVMGERISGTFAAQDEAYEVRFQTPGERLILQFSDSLAQQTLGGEVLEIIADQKSIIATTPAGCLALPAH